MRKGLLFGVLGIVVVIGFLFFASLPDETRHISSVNPPSQPNQNIEITASFAIFINGTFRTFASPKYHNLSEDIYIEALNPNTVIAKKEDATWDDFFKTMPFKVTQECLTTGTGETFCTEENRSLKFYLNGNLASNALNRTINAGDQLLISYGDEKDEEIEKQFQQIPIVEQ